MFVCTKGTQRLIGFLNKGKLCEQIGIEMVWSEKEKGGTLADLVCGACMLAESNSMKHGYNVIVQDIIL